MSVTGALHGRWIAPRRADVLAATLAALMPAGARVLDIGCGDGAVAAGILERRTDLSIRGVDVMVRAATRIPVTAFDGRTLPFERDEFDVTLLVDVLHHAEAPQRLLEEAGRVARQAVVIKDHLRQGIAAGPVLRVMDWVGNAPHGVALRYDYWTRPQWDAAFTNAGLRPDRWIDHIGLYPPYLGWLVERQLHFITRLIRA